MESQNHIEAAVTAAADELVGALVAGAPECVVYELAARYDAAFDQWAEAFHFDLGRASFEQRAS